MTSLHDYAQKDNNIERDSELPKQEIKYQNLIWKIGLLVEEMIFLRMALEFYLENVSESTLFSH